MDIKRSHFKLALIVWVSVLVGCAGAAPDYSDRTSGAVDSQTQLNQWLGVDKARVATGSIRASICGDDVGHPKQGWAIDKGDWCVVACPEELLEKFDSDQLNTWQTTADDLRCFTTGKNAGAFIDTEFTFDHWRLDQQQLFRGFDRAFVTDTEWRCRDQDYQIDPDSKKGFWVDLNGTTETYRFYDDGTLVVGRGNAPLRAAGNWRGSDSERVMVNDKDIFRFAVNYGGGRFDQFRSATRKQVCTFFSNPGPRR